MCCGLLFTELMFLVLYVVTAPALTISSGPHLLIHLYLIYAGYAALGVLLSSFSPFLREVIQVCVCGVMLVCYPLQVIPAPLISSLSSFLLTVSPLLALIEGYQIYLLVTFLSRFLTSHIDDNESAVKVTILGISGGSLTLVGYINFFCLDLSYHTKLLLFGIAVVLLIVNIVVDEGVVSDACLLILANYILLAVSMEDSEPSPSLPPTTASQVSTMLGAIVRIPYLISYSVTSILPYVKSLLAPRPLVALALRVISVATFSDRMLAEDSSTRGLGKFLVVTLYTSYVLGATQHVPWFGAFAGACRIAECVIMLGAYIRHLGGWGSCDGDESFSY